MAQLVHVNRADCLVLSIRINGYAQSFGFMFHSTSNHRIRQPGSVGVLAEFSNNTSYAPHWKFVSLCLDIQAHSDYKSAHQRNIISCSKNVS
jgi:biotin carboxylase